MAKKKNKNNKDHSAISQSSIKIEDFAKRLFQDRSNQFRRGGTSISEIFEGLDFDHVHVKRRIASALATKDEVHTRFEAICPDVPDRFSLEKDWITVNAYPISAYDYVENHIHSALGAAIWILDQIRDEGKLAELNLLLSESPLPAFASLPSVWDPCHSEILLATMVSIIRNRNADCTLQEKRSRKDDPLPRCYLDRCTAEHKIDHSVPSRIIFEKIINLIDSHKQSHIKDLYANSYWDWLHRYFLSRAIFVKEELQIRAEIEDFHRSTQQFLAPKDTSAPSPVMTGKREISSFGQEKDSNLLQLRGLTYRNEALYRKQENFNSRFEAFTREVGEFSFLPHDELAVKYGTEIADCWTGFRVSDPYSMCAAFLLLVDEGSDLPWCYFPGVNLQSYYVSMLPWARTKHTESCNNIWEHFDPLSGSVLPGPSEEPLPKKIKLPDPVDWYQMKYTDSVGFNSDGTELYNLSHVIYEITGCIMPRNPMRHKAALNTLNRYGINSKKENQYLSSCISLLDEAKHQSNASCLNQDSADISAQTRITLLEKQLENQRKELSDLAALVFGKQENSTALGINFPYRTASRILVYGGNQHWIKEMQQRIPDALFSESFAKAHNDKIRKADMVWLQTDGMNYDAHKMILQEVRKCNVSIRYFSSTNISECARQLVNADIASC